MLVNVSATPPATDGCESWDHVHDAIAPTARAGKITCVDHAAEEDEYRQVLEELAPVAAAMVLRKGEHARSIGDRAEAAVHTFLEQRLLARGIRIARVYQNRVGRRQRELDRAAPIDDRAGFWEAGSRTVDDDIPIALHVEVTRERYSKKKFLGDTKKLIESAQLAVAQGAPGLPFTVFVALGKSWKVASMMRVLHEHHHPGVRTERLSDEDWWPLVDAFVVPGAVLKKHEVMLLDDPKAVWPAYQHFSTAPDSPVRGLAVARTFLEHRVDQLQKRRSMRSDAFGYASTLAEFGPRSLAVEAAKSSLRAYLMRDPRIKNQRFAFDAWYQRAGLTLAMGADLDPGTLCSRRMPFVATYGLDRSASS